MLRRTERQDIRAAYRKRIKTCEPAGAFVNEQVAAASWLFCHSDTEMTIGGRRMLTGFGSAAAQITEVKQAYPASNYLEPGLLGMFRADPDSPGVKGKKIPDGLCVGDPAMIIEAIKRWENAGADSIVFLINYMEVLSQTAGSRRSLGTQLFEAQCLPGSAVGGRVLAHHGTDLPPRQVTGRGLLAHR